MKFDSKRRCSWVGLEQVYIDYHDKEWGNPLHIDQQLFELLVLEGAQAGLSWITILKKRDNYRRVFDGFYPEKIVKYDTVKTNRIFQDKGIVRNKLKIMSVISNAKAFLKVKEDYGSFDQYIWQFVSNKPIKNCWKSVKELPVRTKESELMSKDLKKRGFKFVGPIICYSFMQASGMVNDHICSCFRYKEID